MKKEMVAVISGGTGYLGKEISILLTQNHFKVFSIGRKDVNITDEQSVEKFAEKIKNECGEVDVLIHAAGAPLIRKSILSVASNDFNNQLDVTVLGAFNLIKYFRPLLSPNSSIIGITSEVVDGNSYTPSGPYLPAKYALKGLLKALYNELKGQVRVYAVSPAFMPGGLNSDMPEKVLNLLVQKTSPENITNPKEVAQNVLELINDLSGELNGKSISVPNKINTAL